MDLAYRLESRDRGRFALNTSNTVLGREPVAEHGRNAGPDRLDVRKDGSDGGSDGGPDDSDAGPDGSDAGQDGSDAGQDGSGVAQDGSGDGAGPAARAGPRDDPARQRRENAPAEELLLVVNRRARDGESGLDQALDVLEPVAGRLSILDIDDPSRLAAQIDAALTPNTSAVVIAGGDGTINAALPAIVQTDTPAGRSLPLGIIPLGTANDLARTLNLPTTPGDAAGVIARGRTRRIDVGSVNGRLFVNAAGIGFSTALQQLPPRLKSRLGPVAYPLGVLRRWRSHRSFRVWVRGNGIDVTRRVIQVTVANGRSYGGGMTVHEEARIDDGSLDVLLVLQRPLWRLLLSALSFKRGIYREGAPMVALHGTGFEVRTRRPKAVATDGEPSTSTPATFRVIPHALEVYVPDGPD